MSISLTLCFTLYLLILFFLSSFYSFFFLFFMNGNTERAQCALSLVCIPQEMGKKGSKKNKKVYKISKKCNKKIMPSGP